MPIGVSAFISLSQVRAETINNQVYDRQDILTVLRDGLRDVEHLLAKEAQAKEREEQNRQRAATQSAVERLYRKAPIMKQVAWCESRDRQFLSNGKVVRGQITPDIGRWQINPVHLPEARSMGIDVFTAQGNARFAEVLYDRSGTQPWAASAHCWQ